MDNYFQVVFLSESGTGAKTSLITRIMTNKFDDCSSTVSAQYCEKIIKNDLGNEIKLKMWDTPGQERYRAIHHIFIKDSHCVILGYDITNKRSFTEIESYHYPKVKGILGDFPLIYLVANKIDLLRSSEVLDEEAEIYAERNNMKFFRVSAYTGEGVNCLMKDIANSLTEKFILKNKKTESKAKIVFNRSKRAVKNIDYENKFINKNLYKLTKFLNY